MKSKVINTAVCDAREVTEESLAGLDRITINAGALIVGERSKELLNRYPVTMNVANVLELPDGQDIVVKTVNGRGELGPGADGNGAYLVVNGKLTFADGSQEAVKSYYRIVVNGKALMPKSYEGRFPNVQVNGKAEYYPDGAAFLKADTEIDDLFIGRAANTLYYCSGNLFFLDPGIDSEKLLSKGLKFTAKKVVIAESLIGRLVSLFDEEAEIVKVPDGTQLIDDDLELKPKTIRKYGPKLCVTGDVSIKDAEALSSLEYLFADGTVSVNKEQEEAVNMIAEDVAMIRTSGQDEEADDRDGSVGGLLKGALGKLKDTQVINAAEYNTELPLKSDNLCGLLSAMLRCRPWRATARLRPPPCLAKTIHANLCLLSTGDQYKL